MQNVLSNLTVNINTGDTLVMRNVNTQLKTMRKIIFQYKY